MDICNATIQEKRAQNTQKRRARYQETKDTINKRRRESRYKNSVAANSSTRTTCPMPNQEEECNLDLQNATLQNQLEKTKLPHFSENYYKARDNFRKKLDNLSNISTCLVCMERYPGIRIKKSNGSTACYRCTSERNGNRFSEWNNMNPGEQPHCLKILNQVEEMLIARISPILQVTYAKGGQLKYSGHTICFPQDISTIATLLPRTIDALDIIIVNKENIDHKQYSFMVSRDRVYAALNYKISNDPYYKDVQVDGSALASLPTASTDISHILYSTTLTPLQNQSLSIGSESTTEDPIEEIMHNSSFVPELPTTCREMEEVRSLLQLGEGRPSPSIQWPSISTSPINEYTTEGLFAMTFPCLFPQGKATFKQHRIKEVKLHEYACHLIKYHDNRFGQHPRFRYFILNILMRHRGQATSSVFVRKQLDGTMPATVEELRQRLKDLPDDKLADQLMRFSSTIRGTRPFWSQRRGELIDMVVQIGCPNLFFTLSAADTKWPDLHMSMPSTAPTNPSAATTWRIQNIIQNPHLAALYMHHRFTTFREEVLDKLLHATDHWYRYEWQHRGSAHIHGFIWLRHAPDISSLQWDDSQSIQNALDFIDRYVSAWNPRSLHLRSQRIPRSLVDDPCLLDTTMINNTSPIEDYTELVNRVERHTKCTLQTCLRMKGSTPTCRYKAPWSTQENSSLSLAANGQPTHTPARNDDRLNLHNPEILSIWRANVDFQPILSIDAVLKYIAKYAAKAENKSETYHSMLTRISTKLNSSKPAPIAFQKMLMENLIDRDIGAQETSHLLLKLPLSICSRTFVSLNVNQQNLQRVPIEPLREPSYPNKIEAYISRPIHLENTSLIEVTQKWTFKNSRKKIQWKQRANNAIVRVSPRYIAIPAKEDKNYLSFCWTELILYKPFRNISTDIGASAEQIEHNWETYAIQYKPWHVRRNVQEPINDVSSPEDHENIIPDNIPNEWQILAGLYPGLPIHLNDLDMLGSRDFDLNNIWEDQEFNTIQRKVATTFIQSNRLTFHAPQIPIPLEQHVLSVAHKKTHDIIVAHLRSKTQQLPLKLIVQGTAGTGKSHLIKSVRNTMVNSMPLGQSPMLLLAPTGVAAFNIQASTIHSSLRIPINEMAPLQGQALASFQECMYFIRYILIDEMSFIGPKLLEKIDMRLRQAFPTKNHSPFGGCSLILFGDLGQLPPVKDIPMYASSSYGGTLWHSFQTIVTLHRIFRQSGDSIVQLQFRELLSNLRNATPTIADWRLLMSRSGSTVSSEENTLFSSSIHLFSTNQQVLLHNKVMLNSLAKPVALSDAEKLKGLPCSNADEEQLQSRVLLCTDQKVMLCANLWVETGLVNGALGQVKKIVYNVGEKPPQLPLFVVVDFPNYNGPPWDHNNPQNIPVQPISRGIHRQIPLKMAWALTIHKSQGLTLERATIDIGRTDRQGLTFTAISRVREVTDLRIQPTFTFERYARMQTNPFVARRIEEEKRLQRLSNTDPPKI